MKTERIVKKRRYLNDRDRIRFNTFLIKNGLTMTDFAKMCNMTMPYLSLIIRGKRAITREIAETFINNGFKVKLWEKD